MSGASPEKRSSRENFLKHLHPRRIDRKGAKIKYTLCMGGITCYLLFVLTMTGILLMFHYEPTAHGAYRSVSDIHFVIPFGRLIRNVHYWAGQGVIITICLHMVRVFFTGAYQPPRHLNWIVGTGLLCLTLLDDFTGYVLRWDQDTFWAARVGIELLRGIPVAGSFMYRVVVGGDEMGSFTILRFYVFHCFIIPLLLFILISYHFWRVRIDGGISHPL